MEAFPQVKFVPGDEISAADHSIALMVASIALLKELQRMDEEKAGILYMDIYHTCDEAPIFRMRPTPDWKKFEHCPECECEGPLKLSFNYVLAIKPGHEIEWHNGVLKAKTLSPNPTP